MDKTCLAAGKAHGHDSELVGLGEELGLDHGCCRHVGDGRQEPAM